MVRSSLLIALALLARLAEAHFLGLSDAAIEIVRSGVRIVHTLPLAELDELPAKDASPRAQLDRIAAGWLVRADGVACDLAKTTVRELPDLKARQFDLQFACARVAGMLEVDYPLATAFHPTHQTLGRVLIGRWPLPWRFSRERSELRVPLDEVLGRTGVTLPAGFESADPNAGLGAQAPAEAAPPDSRAPPTAMPTTAPAADPLAIVALYVPSGIEHILLGPDHVAFVLGLLLVPLTLGHLLIAVSLFTIAHSTTLALTWFGVITLAPSITEPLIALSVAALGIENLLGAGRTPGAALRFRELTVFGFGLIHGIGLSFQLGALPSNSLPEAVMRLLAFNVGVELGQLAFLLVAGLPLAWALRQPWGRHVAIPGSALLCGLGVFWFFERVV